MRWAKPMIRSVERRLGVPMDYLRRIADASGTAFVKFASFLPLAGHRGRVPPRAWHLARLGATQAQDCGTCVQVVVNEARRDGVPAATLRAALAGEPDGLDADERLAVAYGRAVALPTDALPDLVEAVRSRWGERVLTELALAVAAAQVFPTVKRGMGLAVACARVEIDTHGLAAGEAPSGAP